MKIRRKVCVVGQGFVGLPMSIALSNSKNKLGELNFEVIGIEKNNFRGRHLQKKINSGNLPFKCEDNDIYKKFNQSFKNRNLYISTDLNDIKKSKIVIVSVGFDLNSKKKNSFNSLKNLFIDLAKKIEKKTLIIIETTLPPGTCNKIIYPLLISETFKRGFSKNDIILSYSYERIMPGYNYFDSIVNNYRVYSGINYQSKTRCKQFLKKIINYKKYPLYELNSNTECEFSKILENSYRASNIAFIDEWTKYSKIAKVDLFNIINAIKKRKTHNNIMRPGLGVGGYCLTKDPSFAITSAKKIFKKSITFPFVNLTMRTNNSMPLTSLDLIRDKVKTLKGKKVLILGLSYKEGIGDLRNSPSLILYKKLEKLGAKVYAHDHLTDSFQKKRFKYVDSKKLRFKKYNVVIFCTPHKMYNNFNFKKIAKKIIFFDLNNVISEKNQNIIIKRKLNFFILGKNNE